MIKINKNAPVISSGTIEIEVEPENVWEILSNIEEWPRWNKDVKNAALDGEFEEGSKFRWKAGPGTIKSTIKELDPPRLMAWTGNTLGIKAIHIWKMKSISNKTIVTTEESWEGILVRIMRSIMQKMLDESIESGLNFLKTEAELKYNR
jgi:hypothetical protein